MLQAERLNPRPSGAEGCPHHRLMLNEDPATDCAVTAGHWRQVYTELHALAEALLLTQDADWYRGRVAFWSERALILA